MDKIPIIQLMLHKDNTLSVEVNDAIHDKKEDLQEAIKAIKEWAIANEEV